MATSTDAEGRAPRSAVTSSPFDAAPPPPPGARLRAALRRDAGLAARGRDLPGGVAVRRPRALRQPGDAVARRARVVGRHAGLPARRRRALRPRRQAPDP